MRKLRTRLIYLFTRQDTQEYHIFFVFVILIKQNILDLLSGVLGAGDA